MKENDLGPVVQRLVIQNEVLSGGFVKSYRTHKINCGSVIFFLPPPPPPPPAPKICEELSIAKATHIFLTKMAAFYMYYV